MSMDSYDDRTPPEEPDAAEPFAPSEDGGEGTDPTGEAEIAPDVPTEPPAEDTEPWRPPAPGEPVASEPPPAPAPQQPPVPEVPVPPAATPSATPSATPTAPSGAQGQQPGAGEPQYTYRAPSHGGGQTPSSPWAYQPVPPAPPRRGMSGCVIAILVFLGLLIVGGLGASLVVGMLGGGSGGGLSGRGEKVGVINLSGVIQTGGEPTLFGTTPSGSSAVIEQIREAAEDSSIKAVVLQINSPGGSAAASQAIYQEVLKLRDEARKPVVVSMGDVCASGGYYVASAATTIMSLPATMTGSIGVIMESINWSGLAEKYGVKGETITSGKYKDIMSPFRAMRQDERQIMQEMVNEVYGQFVDDVAKARKMNKDKLRKLADGRVYTGSQAKKVGLVDELGSFHDAVKLAGKKGGIVGEPTVQEFGRPRGLYGWLGEMSSLHPRLPSQRVTDLLPTTYGLGPGLWMILQGNQATAAN